MGLDGMRYLETEDDMEVIVMSAMAEKVLEIRSDLMEVQANMIANEVARRFGGH
jgi:hypothetical protein